MEEMTVERARQRIMDAEKNILAILTVLERDTGLVLTELRMDTVHTTATSSRYPSSQVMGVSIAMRLP